MGKLRFKRQDVSIGNIFSVDSYNYLKHKLTCMIGMDYRSMAAFRFFMAACVMGDIVERSGDLFVIYTEQVHLINTSFTFQAFLFTVHFCIAFMMAIGYRTKLTSFLTWFLTISLQAYVGIVGHGGDVFFRMMLFFAIFIPSAECFAVDSWYFEDKDKKQHGNILRDDQQSLLHSDGTASNSGGNSNGEQIGIDVGAGGSANSPSTRATYSKRPGYNTDAYRFIGFSTLAIILQMSLMYISSFFHKSGEEWKNGEATFYAITLDYFATDFAKFIVQFRTTIRILTIAVAKWELWGAFFLFSPIYTDYCRLFGAIGFMAMHLGFVLCLRLGLFFWVTALAQTANLPPFFWEYTFDWFETKLMKGQRSIRVYYNTSSPLSQYTTLIMKTFFIIPSCATYAPLEQMIKDSNQMGGGDIISASSENNNNSNSNDTNHDDVDRSDDDYDKTSKTNNSSSSSMSRRTLLGDDWFVTIDGYGVRRRNLMALNHLASKSPILFLFSWMASYTPMGVSNIVARIMLFVHTKSQESQTLSRELSTYQRRKYPRAQPHKAWVILNQIWLAWVCYIILMYNLNTFHYRVGWKNEYTQMAFLFRWDQGWNMFSPSPPKTHWWHTIHGKLDDDTPIELFKNETFHNLAGPINYQVDFDKPVPFDRTYGNHRWFKFWENGYNAYGADALRLEVGRYICRQFNSARHGNKTLYSFTVYFVHELQNLDGTISPGGHQSLWNHICYDKPVTAAPAKTDAPKIEPPKEDEKEEKENQNEE
ncbi:hypothetical protein DFA_05592 [Cavenderia fasciculata]|uniref:HTTM-like domain-containing protein n=1 Tax=Cavenderia fasciculata TaxID=261658 RepID=F4PLN7_CACFS|nr:uncharacterized protein DFA_05592 [Cavenderia fasciculata]EGG23459.1 hypothetical protein DFA_05592 [Cavenderia fasciculata]|eukprot:XP_004361310.1 hypothetical protein DFA_05592 [Cavenderia fasciculata]